MKEEFKQFLKEEFKQFLKEHNAYDAYCENLKKEYHGRCFPECLTFENFIINQCNGNKLPFTVFLWRAFDWKNTPQGYEYWKELCGEWGTEIIKITKRRMGLETE